MENTTKQFVSKTSKVALPEAVNDIRNCEYAINLGVELTRKYEFNMGQIGDMTDMISEIFYKRLSIDDMEKIISTSFGLDEKKSFDLAKEICIERLLIVDKDWFDGKVSEKLQKMGVDVAQYEPFLEEYRQAFAEEKRVAAEAERLRLAEDNQESAADYMRDELEQAPLEITDPEGEKESAKQGFSNYLVPVLLADDYALKIELNVRLITLMLNDESKNFQRELLDVIYQNNEKITANPIQLGVDKVEPTVANWLKDYVTFVGIDQVVSTIKKAHYFTESVNLKALTPEDKEKINKLLEFYINLKNFYDNVSKYDLEEVAIFPFTAKEQADFLKELEEGGTTEGGEGGVANAPETKKTIDDLLQEKVVEEKKVTEEKEALTQKTRNELDKVADIFEDLLLRRQRYPIIACLEILAETGGLANLLAKDARFNSLLFGYFKRNNLQSEEVAFKQDPYKARQIQHFLKYIFLERLGLSENDAARWVGRLSNIFRANGSLEYAQLAYLDLSDHKFKWTEGL